MNLQQAIQAQQELTPNSKIKFQGLTIRVENPRGSVRSGKDFVTKQKWSVTMTYPYGEIEGTMGVDGDPVDCFLGPLKNAQYAYIIHILKPNTGEWDEDKVMLGFPDPLTAKEALLANYSEGKFYGSMDTLSMAEFKKAVLSTENDPRRITASKLQATVELQQTERKVKGPCGCTVGIADQVIVDGFRGQIGMVTKRSGRRLEVKFRNGLAISRDQKYVHHYNDTNRVSKMWRGEK